MTKQKEKNKKQRLSKVLRHHERTELRGIEEAAQIFPHLVLMMEKHNTPKSPIGFCNLVTAKVVAYDSY